MGSTLLAAATIAGIVLTLLRPRRQNDLHRDDNTTVFHARAGHAIAHDSGFTPACGDAGGFCGDGGRAAARHWHAR
ncbi:hypothetical protein [Reyranella sp.]|uniref:hypothetical protein n=1 Tax=Reyranella sp. TaxID=1929291 RepID=UPI003783EDAE